MSIPTAQAIPAIRNISDTAIWAAIYRARETERPHALFRDPFARRLAGERGDIIARAMRHQDKNTWAWVIRTHLFDHFIQEQVNRGVDTVVNLAAGLDARPYRMQLPPSLKWIEVDLPDLLAYKERVLQDEQPACRLERVALDVANVGSRRDLFGRIGATSEQALIITEGLLIYLTPEEVRSLADDLSKPPSFQSWVLDIASPGLLRLLQKQIGAQLNEARAPLKFAPEEGPEFFIPSGWQPVAVKSSLKSAVQQRNLPMPFLLRFLALFPEPPRPGSRPWSAACLLRNEHSA